MSRLGRLVLDTSSLVGALLRPQSIPREAFMLAITHFDVCVSAATLVEADKVFRRAKFDRYLSLEARLEFLSSYRGLGLMIDVDAATTAMADEVCRDAADTKFLALAYACQAEVMISSDDDLLVLDGWQGVAIQSPAEFVDAMSESESA